MQRVSVIPPATMRVLVAFSLLFVGVLGGCLAQNDAAHEAEGVTGQSSSALVTYFDFIASASQATWTNNDGVVPWGTNEVYGRGVTTMTSGVLEDGISHAYLYTQPKWQGTGAFMRGAFPVVVPDATQHPTATATFGFNGPGNLTFALKTQVAGTWVTLFSQTKTNTGALATKTADLSAYAGQALTLYLSVEGTWPNQVAGWTDFRIVTDSQGPAPGSGCSINGTNYLPGALNPVNACEVCTPSLNTSGWTPTGSDCRATYFDFIAKAPQATWTNNDGVVPWGTNEQYGRGACYKTAGALMDGSTRPYLATRAKWGGTGSFIRGAYTVTIPAASEHPTATATFGFATCCGDQAFSLKTQIGGSWVTLMSTQKSFTPTTFTTTTADLSAYAGQTLTLYLNLEGPYEDALAAWTDLRIVTDGIVQPPSDGGVGDGGVGDGGVGDGGVGDGGVGDGGVGDGGVGDGGTACAAQTAAIQAAFSNTSTIGADVGAVGLVKDATCGIRYFTRGASQSVPQSALHLIGSATKTYVASTILLLAEEGKLSLNDSVTKWIPDVPGGAAVKVSHLLNHTSGIFNYTGDFGYQLGWFFGIKTQYTPRKLLDISFGHAANFAPGTAGKWDYSNTGYVMLGMIIESVTGKPFAQVVHEKILTPIGATSTFSYGTETVTGTFAFGKSHLGTNGTTVLDPSAYWACGNFAATIGDLVNWTEKRGNGTFHSATAQAQMLAGVPTGGGYDYGAAVLVVPKSPTFLHNHGPVIGHGGDAPGFHTVSYYFPEKQATIAVIVDNDKGPGLSFPLGGSYSADLYDTLVNPYFDVAP